jgi:hypothetical protein
MTHLRYSSKRIFDIPDWAMGHKQPINQAEPEQAVLAQLGMPLKPLWFAEHHIGDVTELIAWDNRMASEVRCLA